MTVLLIILAAGVILLGFVVFWGPPYLPTLSANMESAFELLDLKPGQTILDLGSGDGRILIEAAKQGINAVGIELSISLFVLSWWRTRAYRSQVRMVWGNYFTVSWPPADAIFTFMIPRQMPKLDAKIEAWRGGRPVRLASFAFAIPGKEPAAKKNGVFLYEYK